MSNQQSSTGNENLFFACGYAALWDCFFLDSFSFRGAKYGEQNCNPAGRSKTERSARLVRSC